MTKSLKYGHDGYLEDERSPDLDTTTGTQTVTMEGLKQVKTVTEVSIDGSGYIGNVDDVTDNEVTIKVYESAGSNDEMSVVGSVNPSGTSLTVRALGY